MLNEKLERRPMGLIEFIEKVGSIELKPYQREMVAAIERGERVTLDPVTMCEPYSVWKQKWKEYLSQVSALAPREKNMEPFVVRHYTEDDRPIIKGNAFDGLEIGQDREEAESFVAFVNAAVTAEREACAKACEAKLIGTNKNDHEADRAYDKALHDAAEAIRMRSNV